MLTLPITEITKLNVEPGDVVVVKTAKVLAPAHRDNLHRKLSGLLPGAEVVILEDGMSLDVVKPEGAGKVAATPPAKKPGAKRAAAKKTTKP
ncbi:MAG: hypothetical protein ACMVO3_22715 [Thalassobaculum sp.]